MIVFRLGGDDALRLEKEMTPVFKAKDMINLGVRQFYIKITIDGETFDPFSAETLRVLAVEHPSLKKEIVAFNRQNYAVPLESILRTEKETGEKKPAQPETVAEPLI